MLEDFEFRCGYSLVREDSSMGSMEVDHFDARMRMPWRNRYKNFIPALKICNNRKSNHPTEKAKSEGLRFLNPREDKDYNVLIFEDPQTHELVGITKVAKYHIIKLALNHPVLVLARKNRAEKLKLLEEPHKYVGSFEFDTLMLVREMLALLRKDADSIPPIQPPPTF